MAKICDICDKTVKSPQVSEFIRLKEEYQVGGA